MLSDVAQGIFKTLYSYNGETIDDTFKRVSSILGEDEHQSLGFHYLINNIWRPNTPVFFNAGKPKGKQILSACYVVDLQDSMKSIMDIAQVSSRIFQFGSGVGIPIGNLREKDAPIFEKGDEKTKAIKKEIENVLMLRNQNFEKMAEGKSSGPINFMELFDVTGKVTKSGGRARRAAILCLMMIWHPDIEDFIACKDKDGTYANMNISVGVTDKFMECLKENVPYSIHTPYDGSIRGHKNPGEVWRKIAEFAWKTADPGVLFIDTINRYNPLKSKILVQSTNPCGEQPLRPWECCIAKGSKVLTKNGWYNIEDIKISDEVAVCINGYSGFGKVKNVKNNGFKEVFLLKTSNGYEVKSTIDHKFLTTKGWKELQDIKVDDIMVLPKETYSITNNSNNIDMDTMLGWIHGDGWTTDNTVGISFNGKDGDFEVKEDILKEFHNVFNTYDIKPMYDNENMFQLQTTKKENIAKCGNFGFHLSKAIDKRLPDYIWNTTVDRKVRFLQGIFTADGSVTGKTKSQIIFYSNSKNLIKEIQIILIEFGIISNIFETIFKNSNRNPQYRLLITCENAKRFMNVIGFVGRRKQQMFNFNTKKTFISKKETRVVSIERIGIEEVFDIEVPNYEHFVVNGLIAHNCNLSAINVAKFVKEDKEFDWDGLFETAYNITEIMDNLIDVMDFPDKRFEERTKETRPIGLGLMGLSDAMFMMDIKYNSKEGQVFAGEIMRTITHAGFQKSAELAKEKGCFPLFKDEQVKNDTIEIIIKHISTPGLEHKVEETIELIKQYGVRNCQITTAAPTGTTALSCDCSYGIEPCFGLVFQKNFVDGRKTKIINEVFRKRFSNEPWYTDDILEKIIVNSGSLKNVRGVPKEVKDVFVVAHDIKYRDRIDIQAAIQKHCSTAISSTINLPENTTVEEIMEIYEYAYEKELKGVTVYRDGTKKGQPVTFTDDKKVIKKTTRPARLSGNSYQIELPDGDFLVTINQSGDDVIEIILDQDNEKVEIKCLLEFCGKIISKALRWGMPLQDVVKQGKNITGDNVKFVKFLDTDAKAIQVKSTPDCLSKLLERFYIHGGLKAQEALGLTTCPKCGNETMTIIEGCPGCVSCGYSKCGS